MVSDKTVKSRIDRIMRQAKGMTPDEKSTLIAFMDMLISTSKSKGEIGPKA